MLPSHRFLVFYFILFFYLHVFSIQLVASFFLSFSLSRWLFFILPGARVEAGSDHRSSAKVWGGVISHWQTGYGCFSFCSRYFFASQMHPSLILSLVQVGLFLSSLLSRLINHKFADRFLLLGDCGVWASKMSFLLLPLANTWSTSRALFDSVTICSLFLSPFLMDRFTWCQRKRACNLHTSQYLFNWKERRVGGICISY